MIHLHGVSKHYDGFVAVDDVTLTVPARDLLVLLGSSGCGKTTTLRLVAGLEKPNGGEILLNGEPVANPHVWIPPEQRRIGMVFQDYALFPHLTVAQNIAFALKGASNNAKNKRIADMLDLVGLNGTDKRFPHQLSGGQQQRVALARALAPEPRVVLLDEPFSNLDAALRQFMREEVRRILKTAETTAIFVTHDREEAMSIADTVAVMQHGKLLQSGKPIDLYRFPARRDVADFLGEANWIAGTAEGMHVTTSLGTLPLSRAAHGNVMVMIRPEALMLTVDPSGVGCVTDVRFYGHYQIVTVTVNGEQSFVVRMWAQDEITVGSTVTLSTQGTVPAFPLE